jgi:hypothetical protein
MQQKLIGSREFIGDSDLEIDANSENEKTQVQESKNATDLQKNETKT